MNEDLLRHSARFDEFIHADIGRSVTLLDNKGNILLGLNGGGIVFALQHFVLQDVRSAGGADIFLQVLRHMDAKGILGLMSAGALAVSFMFTLWSIRPRFGTSGAGIVFFRAVAAHKDAKTYAQAVSRMSGEDMVQALLMDAYALARIARAKAMWSAFSTYFFAFGMICVAAAEVARLFSAAKSI